MCRGPIVEFVFIIYHYRVFVKDFNVNFLHFSWPYDEMVNSMIGPQHVDFIVIFLPTREM